MCWSVRFPAGGAALLQKFCIMTLTVAIGFFFFFVGWFVLKGHHVVVADQINFYIYNINEVLMQTQICRTE